MNILVINAGSSSLKFQLLTAKNPKDGKNLKVIFKGMIDQIGQPGCHFRDMTKAKETTLPVSIQHAAQAIDFALKILHQKKLIKKIDEITAIGHRVVHGGEKYRTATLITPQVIKDIKNLCELAPLHNPPNLEAIMACKKILPKIPQVAVFDTGFHQTIPEKAFLYALPYSCYKKMGIRRYGFHGTSHAYVGQETIKYLHKKESRIIVCHLGNGSSITAIKNGKSIDTSMGFTPLEGIPMGTRSGDIDPAIVFYLMEKLKASPEKISRLLNKESGLKGTSEISSDIRELWAKKNTTGSKRAFALLAYKTAKYIGAYGAALNGIDAITFTGGIGQNAYYIRQDICNYLSHLGVKLSSQKNKKNALKISAPKSKIAVFVIPTDEEKQIAAETLSQTKIIF